MSTAEEHPKQQHIPQQPHNPYPYPNEPPPPYSPTHVVIGPPPVAVITGGIVATELVVAARFGPKSTSITCPLCHAVIWTKTKKHPSTTAYISGFFICIIGLFCGCCLIPCCMESCKAVEHRCPNCDAYLGKYSRYS